jgi:CRISPR/Cas system-associated endonuclease Cas1
MSEKRTIIFDFVNGEARQVTDEDMQREKTLGVVQTMEGTPLRAIQGHYEDALALGSDERIMAYEMIAMQAAHRARCLRLLREGASTLLALDTKAAPQPPKSAPGGAVSR